MEREARRRLTPQAYWLLRAAADGQALGGIAHDEGLTIRAVQSSLQRSRTVLRAVWALTLAAVGAALALVRRSLVTAAPAAVAAAVLTFLTLLPDSQPSVTAQAPRPDSSPASPQARTGASPPAVAGISPRHVTHARSAATRPHRAVQSYEPQTRTVLAVPGPAGSSTTVDDRKHGSGPDATLVGGLVECLQNLRVSRGNVGC